MKTAEIKFIDLCEEIDYWKEKCIKAEADAEYWKGEYSRHLNESLKSSQRGVANALLFALHVSDDKDGNLVLDKDARKILANRYK